MSSPARRPSPAVYRRRRLAVLLVVLLVVGIGVALVVWQPWNGVAAEGTPRPASSGSPVPTSPAPSDPTGDADETPAAAPAKPSPEASATEQEAPAGAEQCAVRSLEVVATTDKEAYASGESPQLSITLTNLGGEACLIDVGTATQSFTITSGSDTWWRSTDCQSESGNQVVELAAGQTVSSAAPLPWDRTRSSVDTCDGNRAAARPGYYNLTVTIGGVQSQPAQFRLL